MAASCECMCLWVSEGRSDVVPAWVMFLCDCLWGRVGLRGWDCACAGLCLYEVCVCGIVSAWARVYLRGVVYAYGLVCDWDCGCWGQGAVHGKGSAPVQDCGLLRGYGVCLQAILCGGCALHAGLRPGRRGGEEGVRVASGIPPPQKKPLKMRTGCDGVRA